MGQQRAVRLRGSRVVSYPGSLVWQAEEGRGLHLRTSILFLVLTDSIAPPDQPQAQQGHQRLTAAQSGLHTGLDLLHALGQPRSTGHQERSLAFRILPVPKAADSTSLCAPPWCPPPCTRSERL